MSLKKGDGDACHQGTLGTRKQRSEIKHHIWQDRFYTIDFDLKYSGKAGGASVFQIHPGKPAHIAAHSAQECEGVDVQAGFYALRLTVPGLIERKRVTAGDDYKDTWHSIKVVLRASNGRDGVYKVFVDGEKAFDSTEISRAAKVCYFPGGKAMVKLGLYRGQSDYEERVEYRGINLREGVFY